MSGADIGSALRSARQARRLSLSDVAGRAGLSVATLSRIETGKQNVDVRLLVTLAEILRIPPSSVLDGDGQSRQANDALAEELAMLSPAERARVLVAAMKQSRRDGREALHARVESLLTALDLIRDELLHLRKEEHSPRQVSVTSGE